MVSERVDKLLANQEVINTSTVKFLESIRNFYAQHKEITGRQEEALIKIENRFSVVAVKKREEWEAAYDDEKRRIAKICAEYYQCQGHYFADLASAIVADPGFIPTEKQYRALCENRYAKKVIESAEAKPKYPIGSFVAARAVCPHIVRVALLGGKAAMVIESDCAPIVSAARGSKQYKILPIGSSQAIEVEERFIKRARI